MIHFIYFSFSLTSYLPRLLERKISLQTFVNVVPPITTPNFRPKCSKSIPVFTPKRLKYHTPWGGTYLYTSYREVPPPPGEDLSLASVYAPCDSQQQILFTQNVRTDTVSKTNTTRTTIAGDWNTTLYSIDKRGGRQWQETSYRNSLLSFMDELGFVDVYRVLQPK